MLPMYKYVLTWFNQYNPFYLQRELVKERKRYLDVLERLNTLRPDAAAEGYDNVTVLQDDALSAQLYPDSAELEGTSPYLDMPDDQFLAGARS